MGYYPKTSFSGYALFPYRAQATVFLVGTVIYAVLGIIFRSSFKQFAVGTYIAVSTTIIPKFIF